MKEYEVIIVGGGINGCGLFRDLSLNGVRTLLIDKGDFSSQTSQSSSKMLHGGIRYLENLDFSLVQEALEEKNLWLRLTPHLCYEREFYLPLYHYSKFRPWHLKAGLMLYDFLSHYQNRPHEMLSPEMTLKRVPALSPDGLLGCGKYYDGIVDDAKLSLECLYDGLLNPWAEARSYCEIKSLIKIPDGHEITFGTENQKAKAQFVVFLTGPFTDQLLPQLGMNWSSQMILSKGIHLWLHPDAIKTSGPVVLTTKDNRVIFVIPQRDSILVGTTETPVDNQLFNIQANQNEIDYLLGILNQYFPSTKLNHDSIISTYAGVRPLVKEGDSSQHLGKVSRHHKIFRPRKDVYVLLGGKYTTFRRMTQELAKEIVPRLGKPYYPNLTLNPLRQKSLFPTFGPKPQITLDLIKKMIQEEKVTTLEDLLKRRLSVIKDLQSNDSLQGLSLNEIKNLF